MNERRELEIIMEERICQALVKAEPIIFSSDHAHAGTFGGLDAIGAVLSLIHI